MSMHTKMQRKISDYVLGLLSADERHALEQHAAQCDDCQAKLQAERGIGMAVRQSIAALPEPTPAQLASLMPQPRRGGFAGRRILQRQIAVIALCFTLLLGTFGMAQMGGSNAIASPMATSLASTATATVAPTQTPTELAAMPENEIEIQPAHAHPIEVTPEINLESY